MQIVETMKSVDAGVSMLWRWANIIATLLCAAFVVGVFYAKTSGIEKAIGNLQEDMKGVQNLDKRVDLNAQALNSLTKTVDELRQENKDLRETIDTMRNMREAYVYDSAKAALRKQPVPTPTPP